VAGGRPTKYDPEYPEKARKLFEQGCTDREVAEFFDVHETTLRNWSAEHPEFFMALKLGKAAADDRVEQSLYRRALGYSHDSVKILQNNGEPVIVPYVEHYPPDTTAGIFWLKNRRPDKWRDVKAVEHSGAVTHRHVNEFSDEELAAIAAGSSTGTAATADGPPEPSDLH
jgi:hypothetical protein